MYSKCLVKYRIEIILRKKCSFVGLDQHHKYQYVLLNKKNDSITDIVHQIFHVLGRYHEYIPEHEGECFAIIGIK